ncbi:MAG: glycosyltransferase family 1 protein, partial [Verrucomicrobia bacterium]|nr:glycosyltransferase family 1 protein [Verrucomicrobiota bacterium]
MLHVNIIARTNGVGLDQDVDLVHRTLAQSGFQVTISHCRSIPVWSALLPRKSRFDANIFLERVFPRWLSSADKNFLIPNQERFPKRHLKHLKPINAVLCKTQHATGIFSQH